MQEVLKWAGEEPVVGRVSCSARKIARDPGPPSITGWFTPSAEAPLPIGEWGVRVRLGALESQGPKQANASPGTQGGDLLSRNSLRWQRQTGGSKRGAESGTAGPPSPSHSNTADPVVPRPVNHKARLAAPQGHPALGQ